MTFNNWSLIKNLHEIGHEAELLIKTVTVLYCVNVWASTYRTNFKIPCTAQKRLVRTLFATAQQPHSRDISINQKFLPLDKLINKLEGILAYKIINGSYLLNDFLNRGGVRHQIQL